MILEILSEEKVRHGNIRPPHAIYRLCLYDLRDKDPKTINNEIKNIFYEKLNSIPVKCGTGIDIWGMNLKHTADSMWKVSSYYERKYGAEHYIMSRKDPYQSLDFSTKDLMLKVLEEENFIDLRNLRKNMD